MQPQDFIADAPPWAAALFWIVSAVFAAFFMVAVPRLKGLMTRIAPAVEPKPDLTLRTIGAALVSGIDGVKAGEQLERIADALEVIADAASSLAKSEESGQRHMLEDIADKLGRLERR